jgi:hypothetical protein
VHVIAALIAGGVLLAGGVADAQVTAALRIGAVGSTRLVRDSVVETVTVRPQVAPQLGLRASVPLGGSYAVGGDVAVSRSDLRAAGDSASTTVTGLTVWTPALFLQMSVLPWLRAEARLGAVIYHASEPQGTLFGEDAPVEPTLGLGLAVERPLGNRLVAALQLQYDAHRFSTTALQTRGFTGKTVVHRIGIGLSLGREFGRATR